MKVWPQGVGLHHCDVIMHHYIKTVTEVLFWNIQNRWSWQRPRDWPITFARYQHPAVVQGMSWSRTM